MVNKRQKYLRIGIDAISLKTFSGGFNRYISQLIKGLSNEGAGNEYVLLLNAKVDNNTIPLLYSSSFQVIKVYTPLRLQYYWTQIYFPLWQIAKSFDIWHSPVSIPPLWCPTRTIITVHDLAFEHYPEAYSKAALIYWKTLLPKALKRATYIIAVSESTKRDLINFYNLPEEKIMVIYPSINLEGKNVKPCKEGVQVREVYKLPQKYILYVGALQPRKNLPTLVKAFHIFKCRTGLSHKLVIVGSEGWGITALRQIIVRLGLQQEVIFTGVVSEDDLVEIYKNADLFVYPSLYEGFGYPPLEAMAHGIPVIVSNTPALSEVVKDAAVLVDPMSYQMISEKICELLLSPKVVEELKKKGFERIKEFNIKKMISKVLEIYKTATTF